MRKYRRPDLEDIGDTLLGITFVVAIIAFVGLCIWGLIALVTHVPKNNPEGRIGTPSGVANIVQACTDSGDRIYWNFKYGADYYSDIVPGGCK